MSLSIRTAVARATRIVVPLWPLSSFIAVNPLGGHEKERFEDVAPIRPPADFLVDYEAGRITDHDLTLAVRERCPDLIGVPPITLGDTEWSAERIAARELLLVVDTPKSHPIRSEQKVDELSAKWLAAFLDPQPLWRMPGRHQGLWEAWRTLAPHDPQLPASARRLLRNLPRQADEAVDDVLRKLGVAGSETEVFLRDEAASLPGWVAHLKWRSEHAADVDLTSYLAVRLTIRWSLGNVATSPQAPVGLARRPRLSERTERVLDQLGEQKPTPDARALLARVLAAHPPEHHAATWQLAYEAHYRRQLFASLRSSTPAAPGPKFQVVMCIDPRSEGMRRHLEADPTIETYGFAGFFGVPIRFARYDARAGVDSLPALLSPRHAVTETPADMRHAAKRTRALRFRDSVAASLHASESMPAAPFGLAETVGWFSGVATLARTLAPGVTAQISAFLRRLSIPEIATEVTVAEAFTLDERVALAENAIRMMGLHQLAQLVVLAGHGSTSANNLYQSALDCGACGGNPGGTNARAAASMFNDPEVRRVLAERGLPLPEQTLFIAAEHNTVSDRMEVRDRHLIPATHREQVDHFLVTQYAAADALLRERATQLPGQRSRIGSRVGLARLRARAHSWSEVYPELGLADNAALIIGDRRLTRGVDLKRRVFLHSYRPELDPSGSALETIMTAPLVVAQWINHQYYFSTVDPERWGAGTKTIHNAIGTLGVLSGQSGDLRLGLPLQSVAAGDHDLHEPLRLSVIVQAPLESIGAIISRNQVLRNLFDNDWITLTARSTAGDPWLRYGPYGWAETGDTAEEGEIERWMA